MSLGSASARSTKSPKKASTLPIVDSLRRARVSSLEVVTVKKEPSISTLRSLSARSAEEMMTRSRVDADADVGASRLAKAASIHVWSISRSWGSMPAISAPPLVNAVKARKRASHTSGCHAFWPQAGKREKRAMRSEALRAGAGVRSRKAVRMSYPAARRDAGASAVQRAARMGVREKRSTVDGSARAAESARAVASEGTAGGVKAAISSSTVRGGSGAAGSGIGGGSGRRRQVKPAKLLVLERPRGRNAASTS